MWFGTRDGLNRYDSYNFHHYKSNPDDAASISNNTISCLFEDHLGLIWVGTEGGGLNCYDPEQDSFQRFLYAEDRDDGLTQHVIGDIAEDDQGNLWIGTLGGGLCYYDRKDGVFTEYTHQPDDSAGIGSNVVMAVYHDKGIVWLATEGAGLVKFDPADETFKHFRHDPDDPSSIGTDMISTIHGTSDGKLWIGSWGFGLNVFDQATETFSTYMANPENPEMLVSNNVFAISQDGRGNIWLGTRDGLTVHDARTGVFTNYTSIPGNEYSLADNVAFSLYYDQDNDILWAGTWGNGISILDSYGQHVQKFLNNPENPNSLNDNDVFALHEDREGNIWIGTEGGGLNRYNPISETFTEFRHDPGDAQSLSSDEVISIVQDPMGQLWIGTGMGLNKYAPRDGHFEVFRGEPDKPITDQLILCTYADAQGNIWFSTSLEGVFRLDARTGEYQQFKDHPFPDKVMFNDVLSIYEDHSGAVWFGSRNAGIAMLDPDSGEFSYFRHDPEDPNSLGANGIYTFLEDSRHQLWIGTRGSGLNVLALPVKGQPVFSKITTQQGLVSDWILGIREDDQGNLWACGDGISKISLESRLVTSYYFSEANQGAFFKSERTGMFYAGSMGFDMFHPDSIGQTTQTPVLISSLSRYNRKKQPGKAISVPAIYAQDSITFSYNDQMLAFEFLQLDYAPQEERSYAYLLEHFNEEWISMGSERKITFTGLPPGDYMLRVKGEDKKGMRSESEATLAMTILPPWWKTRLAGFIYLFLGLTGLYGIYYWRTQEQRKKIKQKELELARERHHNERLQQIDKLKDQFLANTSHELRTPLQGIIGLSETLQEREKAPDKKQDLSLIISSGKRLSSLVNDILDFSKLGTQELQLDMKSVDLRTAADIVFKIIHPIMGGKSIVLINDIPANLPLVRADENRLQQILHNLVGNAIKFTEEGQVKLTAEHRGEEVIVSIQDTGIGIPEDKQEDIFKSFEQLESSLTRQYQGTGLGLAITRQLVELMNGHISVSSSVGKGSIFKFTLPVSEEQVSSVELGEPVSYEMPIGGEVGKAVEVPELSPNGHFRILVVDDEKINQQVLMYHLTNEGYYVEIASNGEEALKKIETENRYDLVLLDIMMPRLSGYEVCRKIREKHLPSELPVIMITAKNQVVDLVEGFDTGANDYISKPFTKDELLSRIKTHLNLHQINKSNAKFIPSEFLRSIGKESILDVKLGDQTLMEVTVMFSDIRSYTTISESMRPDENFNFLNRYLGYITPVIRKNHGFINQFLGDGIMAIFIQHPTHALQAAIEMQQTIEQFNRVVSKEINHEISMGIGLHSGQLMMGILGDQDRMEAGVVADTVNTASRMEGLTKYFGAPIIISETTLEGLENKEQFHCRFLGKVKVKGKTNPLKIYESIDGNREDAKQKKVETSQLFGEGLNEYFKKSFTGASVHFEQVLKINPDDTAAKLYIKNSARFMVEGVEEAWDGVERMEIK